MLTIKWDKTPLLGVRLYAYIDGEFVGKIKNGRTLEVDLAEGAHVLMVSTAGPILWKVSILRWVSIKTKEIHVDVRTEKPITVNIQSWFKFTVPILGISMLAGALSLPLVFFFMIIPFLGWLGPIIFGTFIFIGFLLSIRFFPIKHTIVDNDSVF